jgi:hypothetical protein
VNCDDLKKQGEEFIKIAAVGKLQWKPRRHDGQWSSAYELSEYGGSMDVENYQFRVPPKRVPLTKDDFNKHYIIDLNGTGRDSFLFVTGADESGVTVRSDIGTNSFTYEYLMACHAVRNDGFNGWEPCYKEVEV